MAFLFEQWAADRLYANRTSRRVLGRGELDGTGLTAATPEDFKCQQRQFQARRASAEKYDVDRFRRIEPRRHVPQVSALTHGPVGPTTTRDL